MLPSLEFSEPAEHEPRAARMMLILVAFALFFVQAAFTRAFLPRISLEDAAESIRSPYWWAAGRTVYNGVSSNVGLYITLAGAYRVFGYSLVLSKWLKLGLHFFSLLACMELLRKIAGARAALLPFLVAGLSPTWLFLNTNQGVYGTDLQLMPILFLGATVLPMRRSGRATGFSVFLGAGFAWAALIYPAAIPYLPVLAAFLLWRWRRENPRAAWMEVWWPLAAVSLGFVLPVALCLLAAKDPGLLIYDPVLKAGMMRGGGGGITLQPSFLVAHAVAIYRDLFQHGQSYMFDLPFVEFAGWLGSTAFFLFAGGMAAVIARKRRDPLLLWFLFTLALLITLPQLALTFPGMRRCGGILFAFYGLLAYGWCEALKPGALPWVSRGLIGAGVSMLLVTHVLCLIPNLEYGRATSHVMTMDWFTDAQGPEHALARWDHYTQEGRVLPCSAARITSCRYAEIFGAIQGYRYWSGLPRTPILAWDPEKKETRILDISLWENHVLPE